MASDYDLSAAFKAIEDELTASMIRNLKRHRVEETKEGYEWSMWQVEQLKALEKYKKENQEKYKTQFESINAQIEAMIYAAKEQGGTDQEQKILRAMKKGFAAHKASRGATAEFFKLNKRKLEALVKATVDDMKRAETAVLRMANDQYRKIIYNAQVYANTGAGTYEKAVDMATKDFLKSGINCIEYANGSRHTIADYADMAIRTAGKRAYLQGEGEKRKEWGISTVIVNKRGNPCPKCLPHCGKVYIDDVWSDGPKSGISPLTGIKYPLISSAVAGGLYHPRCKDSHTTYFEGISTPPEGSVYTRDELNQIVDQYKADQRQQYAERQAEKYERLEKFSLDEENQKRYAARREEWKRRQNGKLSLEPKEDLSERRRQRMENLRNKQSDIDFSSMDSSELKRYISENLKTDFANMKGANTDYVREATKVIDQFEKRMGGNTIEGLKVQFGGTPAGVYAKYDDSTKTLLLKKTGSLSAFEESRKKENLRYRFKYKTDLDYHATETYSGVIWHELGHAVDVERGQSLSRMLSSDVKLEEASLRVSAYARTTQGVRVTKRSEAWAENFAAYMDGGKNKAKVPKEVADMIEEFFKCCTGTTGVRR